MLFNTNADDDTTVVPGVPLDVTATYDAQVPSITTVSGFSLPTRQGYKFEGYFDEEDGGNQYYYSNGQAVDKSWDKDLHICSLYARWSPRR